jgi:integrase
VGDSSGRRDSSQSPSNPLYFGTLSVVDHMECESRIKSGTSAQEAIRQTCGWEMRAMDLENFALVASSRRRLIHVANTLKSLSQRTKAPMFSRTTIRAYVDQALGKGLRLNTILTSLRNINQLAARMDTPVGNHSWFSSMTKALERLTATEGVQQAVPITLQAVKELVASLLRRGDVQAAALFALCWLLAGRLGPVLSLPTNHIRLTPRPISVTFTNEKANFGRVEKVIEEGQMTEVVVLWVGMRKKEGHPALFDMNYARAICTIKEFDGRLSGHSFRRGACQEADQAGAQDEDIMTLTGHKNTKELQRYIGRASGRRRAAMSRVGKLLQPQP